MSEISRELREGTAAGRKCRADRSGLGGNQPQECDWPHCGCDPARGDDRAMLAALEEEGWRPPRNAEETAAITMPLAAIHYGPVYGRPAGETMALCRPNGDSALMSRAPDLVSCEACKGYLEAQHVTAETA